MHCINIEPTRSIPEITEDARQGLLNPPRYISPKYFYDERGSQLFEQICDTPEYYPNRMEHGLLKQYSNDIIQHARPDQILELGSGYSVKTRHLLNACEQQDKSCDYAPFDICEEALLDTSKNLKKDYPWLSVTPMLGDYNGGISNLPEFENNRLFVFLGSTLGNFQQEEAIQFITDLKSIMDHNDHLLIGIDRVKNSEVLQSAYNDKQGLTAQFNLNLLKVLNQYLQSDFNTDNFNHSAKFNESLKRIEMRLVANCEHTVTLNEINETIQFHKHDSILTEISQKYTYQSIENMLSLAGFNISYHYEANDAYFSLLLARIQ